MELSQISSNVGFIIGALKGIYISNQIPVIKDAISKLHEIQFMILNKYNEPKDNHPVVNCS